MTEIPTTPEYYRQPAILPLGRDLGLIADASMHVRGYVQLGENEIALEHNHYTVWRAAHHATDLQTGQRHSQSGILSAAVQSGVADAEAVLNQLVARRLLVRSSGDDAVSLGMELRAVPIVTGIGPISGDDGLSAIGVAMQPIIVIPDSVLEVLVWSGVEDNLLFACSRATDRAGG